MLGIQEHGRELMQGEKIRVSSDRHTDDSPSPTTETDTPAARKSTRHVVLRKTDRGSMTLKGERNVFMLTVMFCNCDK